METIYCPNEEHTRHLFYGNRSKARCVGCECEKTCKYKAEVEAKQVARYISKINIEIKQIETMSEKEIKMQLLDKFANIEKPETVDFCRKAYEFITEGETKQAPAPVVAQQAVSGFPNGIYLILNDGKEMTDFVLFAPDTKDSISKEQINACTGIGVKQGDWALVVALHDAANGEEITLTAKKDTTNYAGYIDNYVDAVADWNGKANTEHLKAIGLNKGIELKGGQYIPALGEMYFVYMNLKAINAALEFVGGTPIERDWYWTSTESSATYAWYLYLIFGIANYYAKASDTLRVRPVSAFIS